MKNKKSAAAGGARQKKSGGDEVYQEVSFKTEQVIYAHTRSDEADMEYKMHCHNCYEIY